MSVEQEKVYVALTIDATYVAHAAATIASIRASSRNGRFRFLILHDGVVEADRRRIESCAPGDRFDWRTVEDAGLLALEGRDHYRSPAAAFRLKLPEITAPDEHRLIYLDSDLSVVRDLTELWKVDLKGCEIGAVDDACVDAGRFARRWGLEVETGRYFNSGVLLVDLDKARQSQSFGTAFCFAGEHADELKFLDQDALNYAFWGRWARLDPAWNVQRHMMLHGPAPQLFDVRRRPAIVHFTTAEKPWKPGAYHPYDWLYWRSLRRTPYNRDDRSPITQLKSRAAFWKRWPLLTT